MPSWGTGSKAADGSGRPGPAPARGSCPGCSDELGKVVQQPRLRPGADELLDDLAVLEDAQRRDVENPVLPRDLGVLVDIQLDDVEVVTVLRQDRLEHRGDLPAGAAPLGPVIHEHRLLVLEDIGLEAGVGYLLHLAHARCSFHLMLCSRWPMCSPAPRTRGSPGTARRPGPPHTRCRPR